ncbi:MAG: hypothetical protein M3537_09925, partial [Chloroflexota bacterium]|nr:hypothetical protein [Chloroflexota bacterium]
LGLWSLRMAIGRPGCPETLLWGDRVYTAAGDPTANPVVGSGEPVPLGSTLVGVVSREVYGPPGSAPSPKAEDRPDEIALECGDGTFVSYVFTSVAPTTPPSP